MKIIYLIGFLQLCISTALRTSWAQYNPTSLPHQKRFSLREEPDSWLTIQSIPSIPQLELYKGTWVVPGTTDYLFSCLYSESYWASSFYAAHLSSGPLFKFDGRLEMVSNGPQTNTFSIGYTETSTGSCTPLPSKWTPIWTNDELIIGESWELDIKFQEGLYSHFIITDLMDQILLDQDVTNTSEYILHIDQTFQNGSIFTTKLLFLNQTEDPYYSKPLIVLRESPLVATMYTLSELIVLSLECKFMANKSVYFNFVPSESSLQSPQYCGSAIEDWKGSWGNIYIDQQEDPKYLFLCETGGTLSGTLAVPEDIDSGRNFFFLDNVTIEYDGSYLSSVLSDWHGLSGSLEIQMIGESFFGTVTLGSMTSSINGTKLSPGYSSPLQCMPTKRFNGIYYEISTGNVFTLCVNSEGIVQGDYLAPVQKTIHGKVYYLNETIPITVAQSDNSFYAGRFMLNISYDADWNHTWKWSSNSGQLLDISDPEETYSFANLVTRYLDCPIPILTGHWTESRFNSPLYICMQGSNVYGSYNNFSFTGQFDGSYFYGKTTENGFDILVTFDEDGLVGILKDDNGLAMPFTAWREPNSLIKITHSMCTGTCSLSAYSGTWSNSLGSKASMCLVVDSLSSTIYVSGVYTNQQEEMYYMKGRLLVGSTLSSIHGKYYLMSGEEGPTLWTATGDLTESIISFHLLKSEQLIKIGSEVTSYECGDWIAYWNNTQFGYVRENSDFNIGPFDGCFKVFFHAPLQNTYTQSTRIYFFLTDNNGTGRLHINGSITGKLYDRWNKQYVPFEVIPMGEKVKLILSHDSDNPIVYSDCSKLKSTFQIAYNSLDYPVFVNGLEINTVIPYKTSYTINPSINGYRLSANSKQFALFLGNETILFTFSNNQWTQSNPISYSPPSDPPPFNPHYYGCDRLDYSRQCNFGSLSDRAVYVPYRFIGAVWIYNFNGEYVDSLLPPKDCKGSFGNNCVPLSVEAISLDKYELVKVLWAGPSRHFISIYRMLSNQTQVEPMTIPYKYVISSALSPDSYVVSYFNTYPFKFIVSTTIAVVSIPSLTKSDVLSINLPASLIGYGFSLAISGNYLFVSNPNYKNDDMNGNRKGEILMYQKSDNGTLWILHSKIFAPDTGVVNRFGNNIALKKNIFIAQKSRDNSVSYASTGFYVWEQGNHLEWYLKGKLVSPLFRQPSSTYDSGELNVQSVIVQNSVIFLDVQSGSLIAGWHTCGKDMSTPNCNFNYTKCSKNSVYTPDISGTGCICNTNFYGTYCLDSCHCNGAPCNDSATGDGACFCNSTQTFGANCTHCPPCSPFGHCSSGPTGTGKCLCISDTYVGLYCNISCPCLLGHCTHEDNGKYSCIIATEVIIAISVISTLVAIIIVVVIFRSCCFSKKDVVDVLPLEVAWHFKESRIKKERRWKMHKEEGFIYKKLSPHSKYWKILENYYFNQLDGEKIRIKKAYSVFNKTLLSNFLGHNTILETRHRKSPQIFNKKTWARNNAKLAQREWVYDNFKRLIAKFPWNDNINQPILVMVHGTDLPTAWKICSQGFANLSLCDEGFYGKGIYFTSSVYYSLPYFATKEKPAIIISFVLPGNTRPITEDRNDSPSFCGVPLENAYQSHYALTTIDGKACENICDKFYDELVVSIEAQIVPFYVVVPESTNLEGYEVIIHREIPQRSDKRGSYVPMDQFVS